MTNTVDTRECILGILLEVTRNGKYSHMVLADALSKHQDLDKKERAFITRAVEGTLENLIQINYIINQFSKVPVKKMKPVIRCIIQSAVYQICYMDAVPDAAACNEAVKLAKKKGFGSLSGFVNGVVRNISRNQDKLVWPDKGKDLETYLSVRYSIPEWVIKMWKEDFSDQPDMGEIGGINGLERLEAMLQSFQEPAQTTIHVNTDRCTPAQLKAQLETEGVSVSEMQLPYAFGISNYDYLGALKSFQDGLFYVQDISSMLAMETVKPRGGDFILDVCAAPGGKSLHMAWQMHGTGRVLARDLTKEKANLLFENKERCKVDNMDVQVWDATVFDPTLEEKADIVIADLPCSGLGVMRRKKDIRYHMTIQQSEELAKLQRDILTVVHRYVKPGGKLVYSTCTVNRRENEENARWFANMHPAYKLLSSKQWLPSETGGDGFYHAVFQKKS